MKWYDVGLAALAVAVAGVAALTLRPPEQLQEWLSNDAAPAVANPPSAVVDPATQTTAAPADGRNGEDDQDEESAGPTPLGLAQAALLDTAEPVVLTLGDSTGDEQSEWVFQWARLLAEERPVTVHPWNGQAEDGYLEPVLVEGGAEESSAEPGAVTVYSGQQSGATADFPASRLEVLAPEEPDLALLSFGHNNTADDVAGQLKMTLDALRERFGDELPIVLIVQQPQAGGAGQDVREQVRDVAAERNLALIDVAEAYQTTDDPDALLADAIHPNEDGSIVWAETVAAALGAR